MSNDSLTRAQRDVTHVRLRDEEVVLHRVPSDGSCWYHAAALALGEGLSSARLRVEVAAFVGRNPDHSIAGAPLSDWVRWDTGLDVRAYARRMYQCGEWAGGLENAVLAHLYNVAVEIYARDRPSGWRRLARFDADVCSGVLRLAYTGRCHYDALTSAGRRR